MKKVKGLKKNFSSLENKKLKNLTSIQGGKLPGAGSSRSAQSNAVGTGHYDIDYYNDDAASGTWVYNGRSIFDDIQPGMS